MATARAKRDGPLLMCEPRHTNERVQTAAIGDACEMWQQAWKQTQSDVYFGPMGPYLRELWGKSLDLPFPLTTESLAAATTPMHHRGAARRLETVLERILRNDHVQIAVLGGSMPAGHGAAGHPKGEHPWPLRTEELFHALGYLRVTVKNLAVPSSTSKHVVDNWAVFQQQLSGADLIFIDYGINDRTGHPDYKSEDAAISSITTSFTELVAALVNLPQQPALIDVETFYTQDPASQWCSRKLVDFPHWPVLSELNVPTISFSNAVCPAGHHYWILQGDYHELEEGKEDPHPGDITHDLVARTIMAKISNEINNMCMQGATGTDFYIGTGLVRESTRCLMTPLTVLSPSSGTLFPDLKHDINVWYFGEDVPGKPGWIANPTNSSDSGISFVLNVTKGGWVRLEFLATYENIGAVTIWMDDDSATTGNECIVNGLWSDHSSQAQSVVMQATLPSGQHVVHVRSDGNKFKILGLSSC